MKYRFHPDALHEYEKSALYYFDISPQLARKFVEDVEKAIKRIQRNPSAWTAVDEDVRRCMTKNFPFGIYYTIEDDHFLIVAVMHLSRIPGYWKKRILIGQEKVISCLNP